MISSDAAFFVLALLVLRLFRGLLFGTVRYSGRREREGLLPRVNLVPALRHTVDQVKAAFVRMANKLYADREFYITELTAIKDRLADTTALEKERRILDEQLGIDAKAVTDLIARNARVAQNQKEYNERYDALVSRYEDTERKRDAVVEQIDQIMIRRRKIERFIETVKDLPELIAEFDESLWAALVDSMTVYAKDRIVFRLTCGMEIEV